jgi:hypothetical protein
LVEDPVVPDPVVPDPVVPDPVVPDPVVPDPVVPDPVVPDPEVPVPVVPDPVEPGELFVELLVPPAVPDELPGVETLAAVDCTGFETETLPDIPSEDELIEEKD